MTTDLRQMAPSPSPATVKPCGTLRELAHRMAVLISALPPEERLTARCELAARVAARQRPDSANYSLYSADSVVAQEIDGIADQLVELFGESPLAQHSWGDFAIAFSRELAKIETCTRRWNDRLG